MDSNQGYNPYKWVICPLSRVINLHITSYIQYPEPLSTLLVNWPIAGWGEKTMQLYGQIWGISLVGHEVWVGKYHLLGQWQNFKTFWDYIFRRENRPFKRLYFRVRNGKVRRMPPAIPLGCSFIIRLTQGDEKPGQVFFSGSGAIFFWRPTKKNIPGRVFNSLECERICFF